MRNLVLVLAICLALLSPVPSRIFGRNESGELTHNVVSEQLPPQPAGDDPCPATGDCCSSHPSPGCEDFNCCDQVCNTIPSCCDAVWSQACAARAVIICDVCEKPFVCPQEGDCCSAHFTGGCDREGCCNIVCALDSFCCDGKWDDPCTRKAMQNCNNCICPVFGNLDTTPAIDLRDFAGFTICFAGPDSSAIPAACACADHDGDRDTDLVDYNRLAPLLNAEE